MAKKKTALLLATLLLLVTGFSLTAQRRFTTESARPLNADPAKTLPELVNEAAHTALVKFADKKLTEAQLSITLIDLRDVQHPATASFRGNERVYPASVVKLFYLVAVHRWLEDKRIEPTDELKRAMHDMIVDSSNEATQYVVDVLTHTTGGYELPPKEMEEWQDKRNVVNRYYLTLGYTNINTNQKTFCEDAYGREKVSRGPNGENRNKLTTDATARLLSEIVTGRAVSPARSAQMMELAQARFRRHFKRQRRSGPRLYRHRFAGNWREALVESRLDQHDSARRRVHRTTQRREVRARDFHHRSCQRTRDHPDRGARGD